MTATEADPRAEPARYPSKAYSLPPDISLADALRLVQRHGADVTDYSPPADAPLDSDDHLPKLSLGFYVPAEQEAFEAELGELMVQAGWPRRQ